MQKDWCSPQVNCGDWAWKSLWVENAQGSLHNKALSFCIVKGGCSVGGDSGVEKGAGEYRALSTTP